MNDATATQCACPDCKCEVTEGHRYTKDGKDFCTAKGSPDSEIQKYYLMKDYLNWPNFNFLKDGLTERVQKMKERKEEYITEKRKKAALKMFDTIQVKLQHEGLCQWLVD